MSEIADIATAVGAAIAAIGVLFVGFQVLLQRREGHLQAVTLLLSELNTIEQRRNLQVVYSEPPNLLVLEQLSDKNRAAVEEVGANLDRLGFRVREGQVKEKHVYRLFWDIVIRTRQQLGEHIRDQSEKRRYQQWPDYEWLAMRFKVRHLREKGIPPKTYKGKPLDELLKIEALPLFKIEQRR